MNPAIPILARYVVLKTAYYATEYVVDNYVRDKVIEPAVGGIVYCDLAVGHSGHSGVYIGNGQIIELDRKGNISTVSYSDFMQGLTGINIYTCCYDGVPIGAKSVAERALDFQSRGETCKYNLFTNNCHIFSSSCVTGNHSKKKMLLSFLKNDCKEYMGANAWRIWNYSSSNEMAIDYEDMFDLYKKYQIASWGLLKKLNKLNFSSIKNAHRARLMNLFRSFDEIMDVMEEEGRDFDFRSSLLSEVIEGIDESFDIIESKLKAGL